MQPPLQLDGATLNTTALPKFLGVTTDRAFSFGTLVSAIVSKASNWRLIVASLTSKRWGWRKDQLLKVYRAIHLSLINYATPAYSGWPQPDWASWNAAKSTPLETLRIEAGVPSFGTQAQQ